MFSSHGAAAGDERYVEEVILMINKCRKILLELFKKQFGVIENSNLTWISFLDPRVTKRMPHLSPADAPQACENVVRAAVDLADSEQSTPFRFETNQRHTTPVLPAQGAIFNMRD